MTDFSIFNAGGSISAVLKTDLINFTLGNNNNFTIMQISGVDSATEKTVFGSLKQTSTNLNSLIQFCTANSLKLSALVIGGINPTSIPIVS